MSTFAFSVTLLAVDDTAEVVRVLNKILCPPDFGVLRGTGFERQGSTLRCGFQVAAPNRDMIVSVAKAALDASFPDAQARVRTEPPV